jgi:hypothetical protein
MPSRRAGALVTGVLAAVCGSAPYAQALELSAFVSTASPSENWARGYGGALGSTWFKVVTFEGEVARQAGDAVDSSMTSFTGSALLAPPVGRLVPYGGLGVGLFRQSLGSRTDTGTLHALVLGAKLKLGLLLLKAEYRRIDVSGDPLLEINHRFSAGAGVSF